MIKNSSSLAMAALLISGSMTEEAKGAKVEQKNAFDNEDATQLQIENQLETDVQLDISEDLERKHHKKSHKHINKKKNQNKQQKLHD